MDSKIKRIKQVLIIRIILVLIKHMIKLKLELIKQQQVMKQVVLKQLELKLKVSCGQLIW